MTMFPLFLPERLKHAPKAPLPRILKPRTIGVLIFDDFQLLDAAGPIGAFEMPMRGHEAAAL